MENSLETGAHQAEDWAGEMGIKWLKGLDRFEGMIAPIGEALLARAAFKPGERVLDIGCGGGATTIAIARAVAPGGQVLGVDISPDLTTAANARASNAGTENAAFLCADAATVSLPQPPFDRLFSRFGSMFFDGPVAAFTNLHGLLRQHARIDLAVWGPPRENLWMMEMMGVVRNHVEVPPAIPRTPGPFAFEDLGYLRQILGDSGFSAIDVQSYEGLQPVGGPGATGQEAADFALASLAAGRLLAEKSAEVQLAARQELTAMFARHHIAGSGVMMKGKAWLVSAMA